MGFQNSLFQATALGVCSCILAQLLAAYQEDNNILSVRSKIGSLDQKAIIHFAIFTLISTAVNLVWQRFLEIKLPTAVSVGGPTSSNEKETAAVVKTSWINIFVKFILDQTVGAAINIPLYIGITSFFQGQNLAQIATTIETDAWPIYTAGLKLWPIVSLLNFILVQDQEQRVLLGSLAGVGWNIYLALRADTKRA